MAISQSTVHLSQLPVVLTQTTVAATFLQANTIHEC